MGTILAIVVMILLGAALPTFRTVRATPSGNRLQRRAIAHASSLHAQTSRVWSPTGWIVATPL
jgi:hypothetical protein